MNAKERDRQVLRQRLADFPTIFEQTPPEFWWRRVAKYVIANERDLNKGVFQTPETRTYLASVLGQARQQLLSRAESSGDTIQDANDALMNFSRQTAERFSDEREPIAESFVPLNELVARFPQRIRLEEGEAIDGVKVTNLFLKHPYEEQWTKVALPHTTIAHKGGAPRVVLDIVAGSDLGMQAAELPLHDFDVVIAGDHGRNFKLALATRGDRGE
jgi:hypothetical protein